MHITVLQSELKEERLFYKSYKKVKRIIRNAYKTTLES